ncbi:MAG TPA: hypothetical protein GX406_08905, partial [Pseudoclavibacter sp.]|nr:hypothetical protein [Pseudoclavibacter sp.]
LIAASGLVASRLNTPLNLVLAGTLKGADPDQVAAMVPPGVNAITHFEYIADEYLQMWYKTLDIAVFPYRRILNSGSVFLSTTFGIPSILPDEPSLEAEFSQEPWVSFYSTSDNIPTEELLAQQIVKTLRSDLEAKSLAARTYAREHTPYQMSKAYTDLVDEITGESMRNA